MKLQKWASTAPRQFYNNEDRLLAPPLLNVQTILHQRSVSERDAYLLGHELDWFRNCTCFTTDDVTASCIIKRQIPHMRKQSM